jgi:hypothetical protein
MPRTPRIATALTCLALAAAVTAGCDRGEAPASGGEEAEGDTAGLAIAPDVGERLERFAPTELTADLGSLSEGDRRAVELVIEASRQLDPVFLRQVWAGNPALAERVDGWRGGERGAAREYFEINYGPWDRLEEMEPFVGSTPHPEGAGFYPEDMTSDELEGWIADHPDQREALTSTVTLVRRAEGGGLAAVPYSEAFAEWLRPAADRLREAAEATGDASLARFLRSRADALASDDYYQSDVDWMDVGADAPVEVTFGPYETYEDGLLGYKASFESYVTVALPAEGAALARFKERLPWLESNLPIPDDYKNPNRGTESPIRVVDLVFSSGEARAGVQTLAYNLPNDERVREAKGSKKVLLRNVMRAKYDTILVPIAERVLATDQVDRVSFDAYFAEVLHHELAHGLGPGKITVDGRPTEVRLELKDLYSTVEEAKADVAGVYDILALIGEGEIDRALLDALEPTYVAGLFRAARFGVGEAHGQGVVAQFNYLQDRGALEVDAEGRYRVVSERFPDAIRALLHDLLVLQATGDYEGTAEFLERWGTATPALLDAIGRLGEVPVDVRPIYPAAGETAPQAEL